jgi:hypothetical protein
MGISDIQPDTLSKSELAFLCWDARALLPACLWQCTTYSCKQVIHPRVSTGWNVPGSPACSSQTRACHTVASNTAGSRDTVNNTKVAARDKFGMASHCRARHHSAGTCTTGRGWRPSRMQAQYMWKAMRVQVHIGRCPAVLTHFLSNDVALPVQSKVYSSLRHSAI